MIPSTEEDATLKRLQESDTKKGLYPKLILLRQKLAKKAKEEPNFRFYSLFSLIYRLDVLATAWNLVKANDKLIRYADDFVVLMRHQSAQTEEFIRDKLEDWMGLVLNKEKTKVVNLKEKGKSINFLGFNMRYVKRDIM